MLSAERHLLSHDGGTTFSVPWATGSGYTAAADYPQPIEPLRILHVDADIVVVSKPARAMHSHEHAVHMPYSCHAHAMHMPRCVPATSCSGVTR